jgi:hypothetical protein
MGTQVRVIESLRIIDFTRAAGTFSIPFDEIPDLIVFLQEVKAAYKLGEPIPDMPVARVLGGEA